MMDLGATVCTARQPRCLLCPLASDCLARAEGDPGRYPVKAAKRATPERTGAAWWIERAGRVWLVRRAEGGMLGGMRALPDDGWSARDDGSGKPPLSGEWLAGGAVGHTFTHFHLSLKVQLYSGSDWASLDGLPGEWWPLGRLAEAGLPTLFAKAAGLARAVAAAAE
jgi:A/G-specific adenine glycosylase